MLYNVGNCGARWGNWPTNSQQMGPKWGSVAQMFLGSYLHGIDSKGRLTLPAKFRPELATGVVVTRGLDGCLWVFPIDMWKELAEKINSLPTTQKDSRDFTRYMFSRASDCVPDKQGRILLPTHLREFANLDGETMILGAQRYLEIWNAAQWKEAESKLEKEGDTIAERLAQVGLP